MTQKNTTEYGYVKSRGLYRKKIKDSAGKYIQISAKTPERLEEKIAEYQRNSALSKTGKKNQLFCDYAQAWLDLHSSTIGYGTRVSYQSLLDAVIFPALKGKRMLDIKPKDIQTVIASISDKSYSINKNTLLILNQIFKFACENKDVLKNPCEKIAPGGIPQKSRTALTDEQVDVLLAAVNGLKAYPFCMIALYAGLRREEILGLKWDCVDLGKTPSITVKRALRFEHNRPVVSEKLKTKASKRVIPIPTVLSSYLSELKEQSHSDYVISNSDNGPLSETQFFRLWHAVKVRSTAERVYKVYANGKCIERKITPQKGAKAKNNKHYYTIDFEVTPHILRHTYITSLLNAGVDVKTVQYLAGHEKSKITLDIYAHLKYNRPEQLIGKVRAVFPSEEVTEE